MSDDQTLDRGQNLLDHAERDGYDALTVAFKPPDAGPEVALDAETVDDMFIASAGWLQAIASATGTDIETAARQLASVTRQLEDQGAVAVVEHDQ
jgi:hypothetical protein